VRFACLVALLLPSLARGENHTLMVSAAPPLDGQRLADTLGTYLDSYSIEVRAVPPIASSDLREQLERTASAASAARAIAGVRIGDSNGKAIEIQVVDRITGKTLLATVDRPSREEDLYRTVALKVQSLLRSTLFEAPAKLEATPALARLVATTAPPTPRARRLFLEAGYALVSFPIGAVVQQGVGLQLRLALRRPFEIFLGVDALGPVTAQRSDVTAVLSTVPIRLGAAAHLRRGRFDGALGIVGEVLVVALNATSTTSEVSSYLSATPALGAQLLGRIRLTEVLGIYLRSSVMGLLLADSFTVRGENVIELAGLQVDAQAGLAVALW
jgi:hypothetical protein